MHTRHRSLHVDSIANTGAEQSIPARDLYKYGHIGSLHTHLTIIPIGTGDPHLFAIHDQVAAVIQKMRIYMTDPVKPMNLVSNP